MKTEKELRSLLNKAHKEWKRIAETYGYCHPMAESLKIKLERIRYALGALTKQEV